MKKPAKAPKACGHSWEAPLGGSYSCHEPHGHTGNHKAHGPPNQWGGRSTATKWRGGVDRDVKKGLPLAGDSTPNNPLPDLQSPEHRKLKKLPTRKEQQRRAAESGVSGRDVYEEDEDMTDTMTKTMKPWVNKDGSKDKLGSAHVFVPHSKKPKECARCGAPHEKGYHVSGKSMTDDELLAERIEKGGFLNEQSRFDAPVLDRAAWKGKVFNLVGEAVAKAEASILADRAPRCDAHQFAGSGGILHAPLNMVCTCDAPVRKSAIAERAASYLSKIDAESLRVARELGLPLDAGWIEGVLDGGDDLELSAEEPDLVKASSWSRNASGGSVLRTKQGSYVVQHHGTGTHTLRFHEGHGDKSKKIGTFQREADYHLAQMKHSQSIGPRHNWKNSKTEHKS